MRLISLTGAEHVTDPQHGEAHVGDDGVFEVPHEFGVHLAQFKGSWKTEGQHVADHARRSLEDLADPRQAVKILHDMRTRLAAVEAEVASLRAGSAGESGEDDAADAADTAEGDEPDGTEEAAGEQDDDGSADEQGETPRGDQAPEKQDEKPKAPAKTTSTRTTKKTPAGG